MAFARGLESFALVATLFVLSAHTDEDRYFGENCITPEMRYGGLRCPPTPDDKEGKCISRWLICDRKEDCPDGFDEANCEGCAKSNFRCFNGKCAFNWQVCNGERGCDDGSDEMVCEYYFINKTTIMTPTPVQETTTETIPSREHFGEDCPFFFGRRGVRCPLLPDDNQGRCILRDFICDRRRDCPDGFDESRCDGCPMQHFRCDVGKCIVNTKVCDHTDDCGDGSDEECDGYFKNKTITTSPVTVTTDVTKTASTRTPAPETTTYSREGKLFAEACTRSGFNGMEGIRCPSVPERVVGKCIHRKWICDTWDDCADRFDETSCEGCPQYQFRCSNGNCIKNEKMCDYNDDCGDGSDEICEGYFKNSTTTTIPVHMTTDLTAVILT